MRGRGDGGDGRARGGGGGGEGGAGSGVRRGSEVFLAVLVFCQGVFVLFFWSCLLGGGLGSTFLFAFSFRFPESQSLNASPFLVPRGLGMNK